MFHLVAEGRLQGCVGNVPQCLYRQARRGAKPGFALIPYYQSNVQLIGDWYRPALRVTRGHVEWGRNTAYAGVLPGPEEHSLKIRAEQVSHVL